MTLRCSGYQIMKKIKAILFSCFALIYLSLENYIASVVVLWRQAYFQGAAQQRWSPWNHSCCQRIGATTVHTGHTLHSVAQTVLLSQNWCYNRAKSAECSAHSVVATDLVPFHSFHWGAADAGVDVRPLDFPLFWYTFFIPWTAR